MNLVRFRLFPKGSWRTPWQADTLMGAIAAVAARASGPEWLEAELLAPWRRNDPPFVLSDACPGDLLPAPALLPLFPRWPEAERKLVKKAAWLTPEQFDAVQKGGKPAMPQTAGGKFGFAATDAAMKSESRMRNTLDRLTDTTGNAGSLYPVTAIALESGFNYLSLYARVAVGKEAVLTNLLRLLADSGFGADVSTGFGHFGLAEGWEDASGLDRMEGANGWISLSTFQPAAGDPTEGYWQSFVKYGKLGPDFGIADVFKRPQWMLRPGACFRSKGLIREWYGRPIEAGDLLSAPALAELDSRGIHPIQPAYALAVPFVWPKEVEA
ncbi:MAG TPA: hypothetical protein VFZ08_06860 [Terriglobia bacterium]|nr:hypothetical protein [Terriglobia bacterium]